MLAGHVDEDALRAAFKAHTDGETKFTRRMAVNIADFFGVPPMSLVWKLEKMNLLKRGSWDWFRANGGITKEHIAVARADRTDPSSRLSGSTTESARVGKVTHDL